MATFFSPFIGPGRPISWVLQFWPILVVSFVFAFIATALCKKIAIRFGIVDKPDALVKTHRKPVAYLGGIGMFTGFTVGLLTGIYVTQTDEYFRSILKLLLGVLAGGAIACAIGLIDDLFDLTPMKKVAGQVVAGVILLLVGIKPSLHAFGTLFNLELGPSFEIILGVPIVIFFVLGATNSLNLLDGLDGLCAGVTAIITVAMLFLAVHLATWNFSDIGDPVRIIICLSLAGGVCGFLPFNRHPAKIFMGDAGSMLLGFEVAALMILFAESIPRWWMASIVVFGLPILDTAVALVRRLLNKRPLFVSDRGHIYDQLIDRGIPLKKTVGISYLLAGLYAAIGLVMSQIRTRYAAVVYALVFLVSAIVVWKKGFLKMEGLRGAIQKQKTDD